MWFAGTTIIFVLYVSRNYLQTINNDVIFDPTLQRRKHTNPDDACDDCGGMDSVFFQKHDGESMDLIYVCCRDGCFAKRVKARQEKKADDGAEEEKEG